MNRLTLIIINLMLINIAFGTAHPKNNDTYKYWITNIQGDVIGICNQMKNQGASYEFSNCKDHRNLVMMGTPFKYIVK